MSWCIYRKGGGGKTKIYKVIKNWYHFFESVQNEISSFFPLIGNKNLTVAQKYFKACKGKGFLFLTRELRV